MKLFERIADLHIETIHHGLLPLLGPESLGLIYRGIACLVGSGVWIAEDNGKVLGFIAGCIDTRKIFVSVLMNVKLELLFSLHKFTLSRAFFRKLPSVLFYPFCSTKLVFNGQSIDKLPKAELLAMAVSPDSRRQGLGKLLVKTLEREFSCWDITSAYHVKTNLEEMVSNNFYRSIGFEPYGTVRHHDLTLQIYVKKIDI